MRRRIRNILSWLLGAVVVAIVVAVVGEWFIEAAKDKGWYDNAGDVWDVAMSAVLSYLATPFFYVPFTACAGLVGGLWLDTGLRFREARKNMHKTVDWSFLEDEVKRAQFLIGRDLSRKDNVEDGYSAISQESVATFYALLFYLHECGLAPKDGIPSPKIAEDEELFFEVATRYLATIEPFVRAKNAARIVSLGGSTIDLVYRWSNEKKAQSKVDLGNTDS